MIDFDSCTTALALERERIARELHDDAIQRLFATGLLLRSALDRRDLEAQVVRAVDDLDEVMRGIRATIYALHEPRALLEGPAQAVRAAVAEAGRVLADEPDLVLTGAIDDLPSDVALDVVCTCRELLSNVVRHARAARCWVHIRLDADGLSVTVDDDGIGCPTATIGGLGVGNVRARAVARGGRCTWTTRRPLGTTVNWWIPAVWATASGESDHIAVPLPGFETEHAA